jgi:hypothetical protein
MPVHSDFASADDIAVSFIFTVKKYFLVGWQVELHAFYMHSPEIWFAATATVIFTGAGNLDYTLLECRVG